MFQVTKVSVDIHLNLEALCFSSSLLATEQTVWYNNTKKIIRVFAIIFYSMI